MKKILLTATISILLIYAVGQTKNDTTVFNFGFEQTNFKQNLPDLWFQWGNNYILKIDTVTKHSGKKSILIEPSKNPSEKDFGCVAYKIPALYTGKKIELKAYFKGKEVNGPIGLMLRIDGSSGTLAFDNMQNRKIQGTFDWTQYSVTLDYPKNAKNIYIGAILSDPGQMWVDDFELFIDGKNIQNIKPEAINIFPAEKDNEFDKGSALVFTNLTDEKLNNLDLLGKIWGFLKYYHPAIAEGKYNWDYELFRILPKIYNAQNNTERDQILTEWIKNLGTFDEAKKSNKVNNEIKIIPDLEWISNSSLSAGLTTELLKVKNAKRKNEHYYIALEDGVGNPVFSNENSYKNMIYPDAGFRLLSLYRYWNIIQYFFPYKNLIEEDWKNVLKEFIPKFINAANDIEYKYTVLEIIVRVNDTHANIWGEDESLKNYRGVNYSTLELSFVENKAVVTGYYDDVAGKESGMQIGDVITTINNKPVENIINEKLIYTPASNYSTKLRNIAVDLLRTNDTIIQVEYTRNGKTDRKELKTYSSDKINIYRKFGAKDTCFKFINPEIAYLYPGNIRNAYLPDIMNSIRNTKGLIIDFRCYPSDFIVFSLSEYLLPAKTDFVKFTIGNLLEPGTFTFKYTLKAGKKNKDNYKGKVVILVNENTQSSAEYHTMAFRTVPGAKVIGSTTAGADGNVSQINIPGGINTMISGIGVYYPDGKETQRIGIVPDIEIKPSIEGISKHKDEVLDRAIEYINTGK